MDSAKQVIDSDLNYICEHLEHEFSQLAGKNLLIVGGAGFLGHYLVQAVLHWNSISDGKAISLTVFDNYIRGVPEWLSALESNPALTLVRHDITDPLPDDMGDFQYIIHAASIASPTFYRQYPIETMDANVNGLRSLLEYSEAQSKTVAPVEGFYSTQPVKSTATLRQSIFPPRKLIAVTFPAPARAPAMTNRNAMAKRCV